MSCVNCPPNGQCDNCTIADLEREVKGLQYERGKLKAQVERLETAAQPIASAYWRTVYTQLGVAERCEGVTKAHLAEFRAALTASAAPSAGPSVVIDCGCPEHLVAAGTHLSSCGQPVRTLEGALAAPDAPPEPEGHDPERCGWDGIGTCPVCGFDTGAWLPGDDDAAD